MTLETAKATETPKTETETKSLAPNPEDKGVVILKDQSRTPAEFGGLFDDEKAPSMEELGGAVEKKEEPKVEEKKPEESAGEKKAATPGPSDEEAKKKAEAEAQVKAKEEEAKKAEEAKKTQEAEKVVPLQALKETRQQVKALKEEIAALKQQIAAKPQEEPKAPGGEKWKDFKLLSTEEYEQLVDDDPTAALKYRAKLDEYREFKRESEKAKEATRETQARMDALIKTSMDEINQVVPGIYDEDSEIASQLASFAVEQGFDNESYLEAISNPATIIIPPGQDKQFLLGPGAKSFIKLLHTLRTKVTAATPDVNKIKEDLTKELTPLIRAEETKKLLEKIKKGATDLEAYKSLTEVPGSGEQPQGDANKTYSEEDWARLTPEKKKEVLAAY